MTELLPGEGRHRGVLRGGMSPPAPRSRGALAQTPAGYGREQPSAQTPGTQPSVASLFPLLKADQSRAHCYSSINFLLS